jgi:hypothetical protein
MTFKHHKRYLKESYTWNMKIKMTITIQERINLTARVDSK